MRRVVLGVFVALASAGCGADRDLPREYRRMEIPEALLASAAAQTRGRTLFLEHCALCHGERGNGHGPRTEALTKQPRDFTDAEWRRSTSPRRVFFAIREGISGTPMAEWKSLSEQEAWEMTAYVLTLGVRE